MSRYGRNSHRVRLNTDSARLLAEELVPEIDLVPYHDRLDPVIDAIAQGRTPARISKLSNTAAAAIWDEGLRAAAEAELVRLADEARATLARVDAARDELRRPVTDNRLATALVEEIAAQVLERTEELGSRLDELEEELGLVDGEGRRRVALEAAAVLASVEIPPEEGYAASASVFAEGFDPRSPTVLEKSTRALAGRLATEERRAQIRTALADVAATAGEDLPLLAGALDELLREPVPDDAGDDDVWVSAVFGAAALGLTGSGR